MRAALAFLCCVLLASCTRPDGEILRHGPYRVGDVYECTAVVALVDPGTDRARLMTAADYVRNAEFEAFASRPPPPRVDLPQATRIELVSIYRHNQSSWNNGISHAYRSTVRILSGSHTGATVRADGFFVLLEGRGGQPLPVPLKLVGRGGQPMPRP